MKKILSVILTFCLSVAVLSGCGAEKTDEEAKKKPEYVLIKATSSGVIMSSDYNVELSSGETWSAEYPDPYEYNYTYDKDGNKLTGNKIRSDGYTISESWSYDKNSNPLAYIKTEDGTTKLEREWTYHNNGKKASFWEEGITLGGKTTRTTNNTYDNDGNLIKKVEGSRTTTTY